jgi:glutamate transport system permease protein
MSSGSTSVLYDLPGPRARRRALIGSLVAAVVLLAVLWVVFSRLKDQGQFSMEKWGPLIDPSNADFDQVWKRLAEGLRATLIAAVLSIAFSLVLGTALGIARMMTGRAGRIPLVGVIEVLRGLPVVVMIYIAYRVFPDWGLNVGPLPGPDGLWFLVIALTLYNSVIIAEILRAGVASLPRGQREAGMAIGFTNLQTMRIVLLPQSFRVMLPALISQLVVILKDTSLAAVLAIYVELLRTGLEIKEVLSNPLQVLFVVGVIFIAINFTLSRLAVYLEGRLARGRTRLPDAGAPAGVDAGVDAVLPATTG